MTDALYVLAALAFGGLILFAILMQPTCGPGEVRVRAVFGTACVSGHR